MVYVENIYHDLYELSDHELQKKSWQNLDSTYVSSYVELMCRLFDDDLFDEFVIAICQKAAKNSILVEKLTMLHAKLNSYDASGKEDIDILNDPDWLAIIDIAHDIVCHWYDYMQLYLK
jgi:hypothetical protein